MELIAETKVKGDALNDDQANFVFHLRVLTVVLLMIFLGLSTRRNLSSPVVSMILLPKKNSVEHQNLTTNLSSDEPLLYTPENRTYNQVKHFFKLHIFPKGMLLVKKRENNRVCFAIEWQEVQVHMVIHNSKTQCKNRFQAS